MGEIDMVKELSLNHSSCLLRYLKKLLFEPWPLVCINELQISRPRLFIRVGLQRDGSSPSATTLMT